MGISFIIDRITCTWTRKRTVGCFIASAVIPFGSARHFPMCTRTRLTNRVFTAFLAPSIRRVLYAFARTDRLQKYYRYYYYNTIIWCTRVRVIYALAAHAGGAKNARVLYEAPVVFSRVTHVLLFLCNDGKPGDCDGGRAPQEQDRSGEPDVCPRRRLTRRCKANLSESRNVCALACVRPWDGVKPIGNILFRYSADRKRSSTTRTRAIRSCYSYFSGRISPFPFSFLFFSRPFRLSVPSSRTG